MDTFSLRNVQYENRSLDTMRFPGGSQKTAVSPSLRERARERKSVCVLAKLCDCEALSFVVCSSTKSR